MISDIPLLPRYTLVYASIALQWISFLTSVIAAAISAKDLKFDYKDLRACFLYMEGVINQVDDPNNSGQMMSVWAPTSSSSFSCSAIQAISGIDALSSVLMIITLVWLQFFGLERSKTVSWILIGVGLFSSLIALVASCMYSVGLKYTKGQSDSYYNLILETAGAKGVTVEVGLQSSWIACATWAIYSAVELVGYRYYDKRFF